MIYHHTKSVAFVNAAVNDEIIETGCVKVLPARGKHVTFRKGDAKGSWQVADVRPMPDSSKFDAYVYLEKR